MKKILGIPAESVFILVLIIAWLCVQNRRIDAVEKTMAINTASNVNTTSWLWISVRFLLQNPPPHVHERHENYPVKR